MASTAGGDMKGFFKQRKKSGGGISKKPSPSSTSQKSTSTGPNHSASFGSGISQPPALIYHGGSLDLCDDYDANEEALRQFDMNMAYGPCIGMTRIARWERAYSHGLSPPEDIEHLLRSDKVRPDSLWEARI